MRLKKKIKKTENKEQVFNRFEHYASADDFLNAHILGIEPMTAKELEVEKQDSILNDLNYYVEEKFDGTRGMLHLLDCNPNKSLMFKHKSDKEKYLTYELLRGTGYTNGKARIYRHIVSNVQEPIKDLANFLKSEWGVGGHSPIKVPYLDDLELGASYNPKAFEVYIRNDEGLVAFLYTWVEVANKLKDLVAEGIYYPQETYARCFSRRISKHTNWFCENTDSLPHLRDLKFDSSLAGTILDGEMFIPNRPFKDVASTLNCLPEKAIERQRELGNIVFHTFDIVYYKGACVRGLPLYKRKKLLEKVVKLLNSPYIKMVTYNKCSNDIDVTPYEETHNDIINVYDKLLESGKINAYPTFEEEVKHIKETNKKHLLSAKALYEYIIATGGEGVMVKPIKGKYYSKRCREYQKIKKFLTRDLVLCDYSVPTREYTGKFPANFWDYWLDNEGERVPLKHITGKKATDLIAKGYTPITKHYYYSQIGRLILGVIITDEEYNNIPKEKRGVIYDVFTPSKHFKAMQVCECEGFSDELRAEITENKDSYITTVVEVKANELFKDTGKLRHPRFMRFRPDKDFESCTWKDHIN